MSQRYHKLLFRAYPVWIVVALCIVAMLAFVSYRQQIQSDYDRISNDSSVFDSPIGTIEYKQNGSEPSVLVVHGSGGGFDQGEILANAIFADTLSWVAPSRFGYLRSALPEYATVTQQADAYVHLLDQLDIRKVAVVALSHGGPSALTFAMQYPERVSSLTLISCGVTAVQSEQQSEANQQGNILKTVFQHDFLYWSIAKYFPKQLMNTMGASEKVIANLNNEQRKLIDQVIQFMNPVSPRAQGVLFDNRFPLLGNEIASITTPTLILHARDDSLQLYQNAEFARDTIRGSELVSFDSGGHLLFAVEQPQISHAVRQFIESNSQIYSSIE
jgi:2-hydroxy-6-oxonona-2,4-dienedioate hydrolase